MADNYHETCAKIVDRLYDAAMSATPENAKEWTRPWIDIGAGSDPRNPYSSATAGGYHVYRNTNYMLLKVLGMAENHLYPYYATYRQIQKAGGQVRKGEHGIPIFQPQIFRSESFDAQTGKIRTEERVFWRVRYVFNIAAQTEGIDIEALVRAEEQNIDDKLFSHDPIQRAQEIWDLFKDAPPTEIRLGENQPRYRYKAAADPNAPYESEVLLMPDPRQFNNTAAYYATLYHEGGHSCRNPKRCGKGRATSELDIRVVEELIAEGVAMLLCAAAGIDGQVEDDTIKYLRNWGLPMKEKPELVLRAFLESNDRAKYMQGIGQEDAEEEEEAVAA